MSNCVASGAWSGARASSGTELRPALTATEHYTLTCQGANGPVVAMTSVQVWSGGTSLTWVPPSQRTDGSPLGGLAGYRIYVGTVSRQYYQQIDLANGSLTSYFVDLLPGEYYIAMTAIDTQGYESAPSNEVRKLVQ